MAETVFADLPTKFFTDEPLPDMEKMTWKELKALANDKYKPMCHSVEDHYSRHVTEDLIRKAHCKYHENAHKMRTKRMGEIMIEVINKYREKHNAD